MQKGQILIWIIVGSLLIALAGGAYYLGRSTSPKPQATPVVSQTPQPTPSPSSSPDETANWKTYTNSKYGYSVKYPPNLETSETPFSALFNTIQTSPGAPGFPIYWVSIIPKDFNDQPEVYNRFAKNILPSLFTMKVSDTIQTAGALNPPYSDYWIYKRLPDTVVDGNVGLVFENNKVWEGGSDLKDRRLLIKKGDLIYMIGTYYTSNKDFSNFQLFLKTFKFL